MDQETVKTDTEAARVKAMAHARRMRLETEMTGRIRAAWAQLDVAVDEIVRINKTIEGMKAQNDDALAKSFETTLALEKARVRGKAEILALIMPAPLNTPDAISAEAGRRYAAKQKGEKYETPGLRMVATTVMDDLEPNEVWT